MLPTRAALLLRISDDKAGDAAGVGRQEKDGRKRAVVLSWQVGPDDTHVIVENSISAFKRRKITLPDGTTALRTVRPGFRRALDMLASGEADGLLVYDLDRLARDPRDLEDLIDVVEAKRVPVTDISGGLDLSTDAGITQARVLVAFANKSSRDTARRVTRKHEELAEQGKPGGGGIRPFGYGKKRTEVVEDEAAEIRWMAARVLEGWSLYAVADGLNARGIKPVRSEKWNTASIKSVLKSPRVAGLRVHRGKVTGTATWPAIIDRDTWEAVCAKLAERATGSRNELTRWLNGVLRCSLCGHELQGTSGSPKLKVGPRYWCSTPNGGCGKIAINALQSEAEIERQIIEYLTSPDVITRLRASTASDNVEQARKQLADDEAELKQLARMWAQKELTLGEYSEARKIFVARIEEARLFVTASAPKILRAILAGDVAENWADLSPAQKREVVLSILPGYTVLPHDKTKPRRFDPTRLQPINQE
ncbi:recombinase family protein [Streptosporangium canum]|uniref:recombinase family protein n=1 Tax=Streptosporangium canum TaxID=324952 RepID=UPI00368A9ECD